MIIDSDFKQMIMDDYRLTTADITYHLPDHPLLLQSYLWQELDVFPNYPELNKFLEFWERKLDGALHSVKVESSEIISPSQYQNCKGVLQIH